MPIQLEVRPEIADKLTAVAKAKGVSVDDLLNALLSEAQPAESKISEPSLGEFDRDMDSLAEGLEHLPAGYHGTYSRQDIYADHD